MLAFMSCQAPQIIPIHASLQQKATLFHALVLLTLLVTQIPNAALPEELLFLLEALWHLVKTFATQRP